MLCYVMLCYVMLCYVMLCYVMLCYVILCHVISCHVMSCHVMSFHVTFSYTTLFYLHMSSSVFDAYIFRKLTCHLFGFSVVYFFSTYLLTSGPGLQLIQESVNPYIRNRFIRFSICFTKRNLTISSQQQYISTHVSSHFHFTNCFFFIFHFFSYFILFHGDCLFRPVLLHIKLLYFTIFPSLSHFPFPFPFPLILPLPIPPPPPSLSSLIASLCNPFSTHLPIHPLPLSNPPFKISIN